MRAAACMKKRLSTANGKVEGEGKDIDDRVYMIRFGFTVTVAAAHHNSHPFLKIISSWTHIRSAAVLVPVTSDTPCSANIRCICIVFILTIGVERVKMYVSLSTL